MILCEYTKEILSSFSQINPSMILEWDGEISVISPSKSVLATAKVPEQYDFQWPIWDVPQLLATMKLFDDSATLAVHKDKLIMRGADSEMIYRFSDENLIQKAPAKEIQLKNKLVASRIQTVDLKKLLKASYLLKNSLIKISFENDELTLTSVEGALSNKYSLNLSAQNISEKDAIPDSYFKLEYFNINMNVEFYDIILTERMISFKSNEDKIRYWIAKEKNGER